MAHGCSAPPLASASGGSSRWGWPWSPPWRWPSFGCPPGGERGPSPEPNRVRTGLRRGLVLASIALILAVALLPGPRRAEAGRSGAAAAASGDPMGHLERFVEVAVAPE